MGTRNIHKLFDKNEPYSLEEQLALLAEISQGFSSTLDISQTLQNAIEQFSDLIIKG